MNPTQNPRKGFDLLLSGVEELETSVAGQKPELAVFGNSETSEEPVSAFRTHYLGQFSDDESLALLYSAVDVFVAPSREDNLPLSVQESLACGTPVVAFNVGGMPDMIRHQSNGYLVDPYDSEDLAAGIAWCIREERREELSEAARRVACEKFPLEKNAKAYLDLYREISNRT
jgi:glycosyltransferase involved in cell wall biosynthesis